MLEFQGECGLSVIKDLVEDNPNLSRIYGFILYTESDPYVAKVLRDEDFWRALDSISGCNWPIFAVRPLRKGQMAVSGGGSGCLGFMVQTWDEPRANKIILRDFGLENSRELPLFVAFMWDELGNLNEVTIPIQGNDIDSVYNSLKEIIEAIAKVESEIHQEYKGTINVFRNVKSELEALRLKHTIIERGKIIEKIADFLRVFI